MATCVPFYYYYIIWWTCTLVVFNKPSFLEVQTHTRAPRRPEMARVHNIYNIPRKQVSASSSPGLRTRSASHTRTTETSRRTRSFHGERAGFRLCRCCGIVMLSPFFWWCWGHRIPLALNVPSFLSCSRHACMHAPLPSHSTRNGVW